MAAPSQWLNVNGTTKPAVAQLLKFLLHLGTKWSIVWLYVTYNPGSTLANSSSEKGPTQHTFPSSQHG
jgi:hypothetical protein